MTTETEPINIYAAKTQLSALVARAEQGERVVISRNGRPVAQLVAFREERSPRVPGLWRGQVSIADDFDDFTPADDTEWYGR